MLVITATANLHSPKRHLARLSECRCLKNRLCIYVSRRIRRGLHRRSKNRPPTTNRIVASPGTPKVESPTPRRVGSARKIICESVFLIPVRRSKAQNIISAGFKQTAGESAGSRGRGKIVLEDNTASLRPVDALINHRSRHFDLSRDCWFNLRGIICWRIDLL